MRIKAYHYREQHKWIIACYVCAERIEGPVPPGLAYSSVPAVLDRAHAHLLNHVAGAIRP